MSAKKRCIYCHKNSSSSSQVPHAFPESLLLDGPALQIGELCDGCNQYFGKELETMLTMHPLIAMQIQSFGLVKKKRKERKKLNVFERVREDGKTVLQFAVAPPVFKYEFGVRVGATLTPLWDANFHMGRFSRGLHMIAFNLAVLNRGSKMAFHPRYAPVRNYVRKPRSGEFWPFLQVVQDLSKVNLHPYVTPIPPTGAAKGDGVGEYTGISLFNLHFVVDLLNTGTLKAGRVRVSEPVGEAAIIDSDWVPPRQEPHLIGDKQAHYRVTVG